MRGEGAIIIFAGAKGNVRLITTETGELHNTSGFSTDTVILDRGSSVVTTTIDNTGKITGTVKLGNSDNSFTNQKKGVWNTAGGTNQFGTGGNNTLHNDGTIIAASSGATHPSSPPLMA